MKELKDNSLIDDDVKELSEIDNTGGKTSSYLNASNKPRKRTSLYIYKTKIVRL